MESHEKDKEHDGQDPTDRSASQSGGDRVEVLEVPIADIDISEFCRRQSYDDLDGLAKSIEKNGLVNPVTVNAGADGRFTLICGSRRLKAHEQLGRETITCHIIHVTPAKARRLSILENVQRKDMHPVELARQIRSAVEGDDGNQTEIADEIGMSQPAASALLGILFLDEDILQQIGTAAESPFKRTHAEILAELARSNRFNRRIEVQQLFKKTVRYELRTKELKALVQFFRTGGYDHLPERLRTSLLHERGMTSQMAMLYVEPTKVVEGEGKDADRRRQIAERLDHKWLETYLLRAAQGGWSFEKTRQGLLKMITGQSEPREAALQEPQSSWQMLLGDVSVLKDRLGVCDNDLSAYAKTNPERLARLRREMKELCKKLQSFLAAVDALDTVHRRQSA